jgi:hypothetical protein
MCTHEMEAAKGGGPLEDIKAELSDQQLVSAVFAEGRQITVWYRIIEVWHRDSILVAPVPWLAALIEQSSWPSLYSFS